jgi:hypothetical protein
VLFVARIGGGAPGALCEVGKSKQRSITCGGAVAILLTKQRGVAGSIRRSCVYCGRPPTTMSIPFVAESWRTASTAERNRRVNGANIH